MLTLMLQMRKALVPSDLGQKSVLKLAFQFAQTDTSLGLTLPAIVCLSFAGALLAGDSQPTCSWATLRGKSQ